MLQMGKVGGGADGDSAARGGAPHPFTSTLGWRIFDPGSLHLQWGPPMFLQPQRKGRGRVLLPLRPSGRGSTGTRWSCSGLGGLPAPGGGLD